MITILISIFILVFVAIIFFIMLKTVNLKFGKRIGDIKNKLEVIGLKLRQKENEMESFIYTVSHDLRTPLINIQIYAKKILDLCKDNLELKRFSESILTCGKEIDKFIVSIAELSRAGRIIGIPENVDMSKIILNVKEKFKNMMEEKKINFIVDKKFPICFGNKERLYQVFLNLIGNSIKFIDTNKNPIIEISCNENYSDDFCGFKVYDNGIGISEDNCEKIFGVFYRVNPQIEGIGLGLVIVKKIVESLGGKIFVKSELCKFTEFHIILPKGVNP